MTKYERSWIKKIILVFAMLFVFGYSPAVYAEEEPKQAPGQELMGEGQEEMSFEDMIGTMEKPEAEKKVIEENSDPAADEGVSTYTVIAFAAAAVLFMIAVLLMAIAGVKKKKSERLFFGFMTSAVSFTVIIAMTANILALGRYSLVMNKTFGKGKITVEQKEGGEGWDSEYNKKEYASADEAREAAMDLTQRVEAEGAVLMKNENSALPLASDEKKITLFGVNSAHISAGAQGEGVNGQKGEMYSLQEGMEYAGFEVNPSTMELYESLFWSDDYKYETKLTNTTDESMAISKVYQYGHNSAGFSNDEPWIIGEVETDRYTSDIERTYKDYSGAAVVTLTRVGGEGSDLAMDMGEYKEYGGEEGKHYLELDTREQELIRYAKEHFSKVIVLINSSNAMELGDLNAKKTADNLGVDAILWIGGVGSTGTKAVGDILAGNVNPSGRTADIYPADFTADPTWNNFGSGKYTNIDETNSPDGYAYSVEYEEGIYIGYRYYETAEAEAQAGNYDSYSYEDAVVYPFGYGLSYTSFEMEYADTPAYTDGKFHFDVQVANTGDMAGRQVVELYAEAPYTYGGIEKSKVVLAGFGKTEILEPGESGTVSIEVSRDDLASYDYQNEKCYVLDEGTYKFYLSENSHSWASISEEDSGKYFEYELEKIVYNTDDTKREFDEIAAVNQLDDVTNYHFVDYKDSNADNGYAHNMTREDFKGSFPTALTEADLVAGEDVIEGINYDAASDDRGDEMPTTGVDNGLMLANVRGLDYDDPLWDDLMDQLTVSDLHGLCAYGHFETAEITSIAAPYTSDIDSPNGFVNFFKPNLVSNGYTTEVVLASTWNVELAREQGECIGEEGLQNEITGWYGPGLNTHRSAFGGRNFEYFSEDGVLAGKIVAAECSGAQSKGLMVYAKHYAVNDQEENRNSTLCTWVNEQAAREIYLKPFELYAKETVAEVEYLDENGTRQTAEMQGIGGVMTAYNMIGAVWAGACEGMDHVILRDEWGLDGGAITDAIGASYTYANADQAIRYGSDLLLAYDLQMEDTESAAAVQALREAAHHILYAKANSNAMNGLTTGTAIHYGTAPWKTVLFICDALALLIAVSGIAMMVKAKQRKIEVVTE